MPLRLFWSPALAIPAPRPSFTALLHSFTGTLAHDANVVPVNVVPVNVAPVNVVPLQPSSPPTHQRTHAQRGLWEPTLASVPAAMVAPATAPSTPPSAPSRAPAASAAAALPRAHAEAGRAAGPDGLLWGDLTSDERRAATWLGYDETSWDRGATPPTCMHSWATLTADEQRAASILGYNTATWNAELEQGDAELEQGDAELEQGDCAPDDAFEATDDADGANDETFGAGAADATTLPTPLGMALPARSSAAASGMPRLFASHAPLALAPQAPVAAPLARAAAAAAPSRTAEIQIHSRTAEIQIQSRTAEIPSILIDCSSVAAADRPFEMGYLNLEAVRQALIAC